VSAHTRQSTQIDSWGVNANGLVLS